MTIDLLQAHKAFGMLHKCAFQNAVISRKKKKRFLTDIFLSWLNHLKTLYCKESHAQTRGRIYLITWEAYRLCQDCKEGKEGDLWTPF